MHEVFRFAQICCRPFLFFCWNFKERRIVVVLCYLFTLSFFSFHFLFSCALISSRRGMQGKTTADLESGQVVFVVAIVIFYCALFVFEFCLLQPSGFLARVESSFSRMPITTSITTTSTKIEYPAARHIHTHTHTLTDTPRLVKFHLCSISCCCCFS